MRLPLPPYAALFSARTPQMADDASGQAAAAAAAPSNKEQQRDMLVRFSTSFKDLAVPSEALSVPSNLNRVGLSHIISHLLGKGGACVFD